MVVKGSYTNLQLLNNSDLTSEKSGVAYEAEEPVKCKSSSGVMGSVMERWDALMFPAVVPIFKVGPSTRIQTSNRLTKGQMNSFTQIQPSLNNPHCLPLRDPYNYYSGPNPAQVTRNLSESTGRLDTGSNRCTFGLENSVSPN